MRIETGETVKATLLANAGVLLEYRGTRLLIDGFLTKRDIASVIFRRSNGRG